MRVFKNKWFAKFAKKEDLGDERLIQLIKSAEAGLIDADYGGGVIKQRIGRENEGKSGGFRTIILYIKGDKAFFVYGFAKSAMGNIEKEDLKMFKKLARIMLSLKDRDLENLLRAKEIEEIR